jgi:hypothetical protein
MKQAMWWARKDPKKRGGMMPSVPCKVSRGLRESEATVEIMALDGRSEFLPLDRDFLTKEGDRYYLPVTVLFVDDKRRAALIALPVEADSGANRIWVKLSTVRDLTETPT